MVVKFRHDDMSEQPCPGAAAGDRVVWRRRRHHRVANPARQFLANVPDDFEPARHVIKGLTDLVGDLAQRATATGAGARCRMPQILSGQMLRQRAPCRLLRLGRGLGGDRFRPRPDESVTLEALGKQAQPVAIPPQRPSIDRSIVFTYKTSPGCRVNVISTVSEATIATGGGWSPRESRDQQTETLRWLIRAATITRAFMRNGTVLRASGMAPL